VHPPCGRGQAVPDPSGSGGPADHRGCPSVVGRDDRRMAGWDAHVPRLWRGGRGSASPLQRGRTHPRSGRWAPRWGAHPRLVGVRRCLTRPAREGRHAAPAPATHRRAQASPPVAAPSGAGGRGGASPLQGYSDASPVGQTGAKVGRPPRPVGARHRLTRHPRATVGTPRALNTMGAVPAGTVSGASPRAGWTVWPEPW